MGTLIQKLACTIIAKKNTEKSGNVMWAGRHADTIAYIGGKLPTGSGFDSGSFIDVERSTPKAVYIDTSFHHHAEHGYDGWTEHTLKIVPTFDGFDFSISGPNKNEIHDYIGEVFHQLLSEEYVELGGCCDACGRSGLNEVDEVFCIDCKGKVFEKG